MESLTTLSKMENVWPGTTLVPTHYVLLISKFQLPKAASLAEAGKKEVQTPKQGLFGMLGSYGLHALNFTKDIGRRTTDIRGKKGPLPIL